MMQTAPPAAVLIDSHLSDQRVSWRENELLIINVGERTTLFPHRLYNVPAAQDPEYLFSC